MFYVHRNGEIWWAVLEAFTVRRWLLSSHQRRFPIRRWLSSHPSVLLRRLIVVSPSPVKGKTALSVVCVVGGLYGDVHVVVFYEAFYQYLFRLVFGEVFLLLMLGSYLCCAMPRHFGIRCCVIFFVFWAYLLLGY